MFKDILSAWHSRVFLTWRIESVRTCCAVSVSIEHFSNSWQCKSHTMLKLPQSFSKIFFLKLEEALLLQLHKFSEFGQYYLSFPQESINLSRRRN